ncbi:cuticle protein 7-like [Planococcus citri]|uniref:cuticle protein 7-like n=1 Tax=Planococcus citri TaxID=170843 RepID=UPI0031F75EC0
MKTFLVLVAIVSTVLAQDTYDANSNYNFQYAVADPITGDQKSQSETRNGETVQGYYQLLEPDGSYRTVSYVSDPVGGFRAQVSKNGAPGAPAKIAPVPAASTVVKTVVPAPEPYVPAASSSYVSYAAYPGYSGYPYSGYPYSYYNGYYPYYSGYYPYAYKK